MVDLFNSLLHIVVKVMLIRKGFELYQLEKPRITFPLGIVIEKGYSVTTIFKTFLQSSRMY